jgi:lipid-A-disaccharide synthase
MKYMLVAGEASGDLHGSRLIGSLRAGDAQAEFKFFGGDQMEQAAGVAPVIHYDQMNVMGFSEVLRSLPRLLSQLKAARKLMEEFRPDALILIDFPGFNLKLAKTAHKMGIKVHYFISPKIWAWKEWRIKDIRKYVDVMYSILPFEESYYRRRHNYEVRYVGNPSVQEIDEAMKRLPSPAHFRERQGIEDGRPLIALLPGSRRGEIRNNLRMMIEAVHRFPEYQYIVAAAPSIPERYYRQCAQDPGLKLVFGCTHTLLKYAQAAVVTSGTATLETAIIGTPQVVCYRANGRKLSYKIMEKLLKVKYVSLPNLIANDEIVPELLVHKCTTDAIAEHLSPLLQPSPARDKQLAGYRTMRRILGDSIASDKAAKHIISFTKEHLNSRAER